MKKCKFCKSEIDDKAKICPNCRKKQGGKTGLIILGIVVVIIIAAMTSGGNSTQPTSSPNATNTQSTTSKINKDNYNKINNGMTKEEVFTILGSDATISESETPGVGKMEMYHYQEVFSTKAITITFLDGKVYTKNWTEL